MEMKQWCGLLMILTQNQYVIMDDLMDNKSDNYMIRDRIYWQKF